MSFSINSNNFLWPTSILSLLIGSSVFCSSGFLFCLLKVGLTLPKVISFFSSLCTSATGAALSNTAGPSDFVIGLNSLCSLCSFLALGCSTFPTLSRSGNSSVFRLVPLLAFWKVGRPPKEMFDASFFFSSCLGFTSSFFSSFFSSLTSWASTSAADFILILSPMLTFLMVSFSTSSNSWLS